MPWQGQSTGYAAIVSPEGVHEFDALTCSHCQFIGLDDRRDLRFDVMGKKCQGCGKWICSKCVEQQQLDGGRCLPYEKVVDEMEKAFERGRAREALFKAAGV